MSVYYGGMSYIESLYDKVDPTADEIRAYYEEHADLINSQYGVSKESGKLIDVRHILVTPTGGTTDENNQTVYSDDEWAACLAKAEDILKQWKAGEATEESFAALAMELTEDPGSQNTGGLYTYVYEGQMVPAFNDAAYALEIDKISEPVQSDFGYHIIQVKEKRAVKDYGTLEEKKEEIRKSIAATKGDWNTKMAELIKEAKVDVAKTLDLILVLDCSNSMEERNSSGKLTGRIMPSLKTAATDVINNSPSYVHII